MCVCDLRSAVSGAALCGGTLGRPHVHTARALLRNYAKAPIIRSVQAAVVAGRESLTTTWMVGMRGSGDWSFMTTKEVGGPRGGGAERGWRGAGGAGGDGGDGGAYCRPGAAQGVTIEAWLGSRSCGIDMFDEVTILSDDMNRTQKCNAQRGIAHRRHARRPARAHTL